MIRTRLERLSSSPKLLAGVAAAAAAAVTAAWVEYRARRAVQDNPPEGELLEIDGTRLHVVERGQGPAVVLIHGNNVWWRDFRASGLFDRLARDHRVIAIDRPGFGHSSRPRDRLWTPVEQAKLIAAAMQRLDVGPAAIVGHSMGSLVALALALDHPQQVRSVALLSGYHFPKLRLDALMATPVALPVLGDVMRYTVTALSVRALLGQAVKGMFTPHAVPSDFLPILSREMLVRPLQLRANFEDAAFMMPIAGQLSARLDELRMPVTIVAGDQDAVVDFEKHSVRLHEALPGSRLIVVPGAGHMVHHVAQEQIAEAVAATVTVLPFPDKKHIDIEPALAA